MIEVRVPATSANLGPGFDTLGLALNIYGRFVFREANRKISSQHLALRAYRQTLDYIGVEGPDLSVETAECIPIGKGLGSSAACIVAGILTAIHVTGAEVSLKERLALAAKIEGHPDNVTPALLGGLVASGWKDNELLSGRMSIAPNLAFGILIPSFALSTTKSRQVVPQEVRLTDVVYNLSQLALSLSALERGDEELLRQVFDDRLHQPTRFPLISGARELFELARDKGALAVTLSGAGPSLLLIRRIDDPLEGLQAALKEQALPWELRLCQISLDGATIL